MKAKFVTATFWRQVLGVTLAIPTTATTGFNKALEEIFQIQKWSLQVASALVITQHFRGRTCSAEHF